MYTVNDFVFKPIALFPGIGVDTYAHYYAREYLLLYSLHTHTQTLIVYYV